MNKALVIVGAVVVVGLVGGGALLLSRSGAEKAPPPAPKAQPAPSPAEKPAPPPVAADKPPVAKLRLADQEPLPAGTPIYRIELASFKELAPAKDYQAEMIKRNLGTEIVEILDIDGRSWYHVRVGRFTDREQAEARLPEVDRVAGIAGIVMRETSSAPPPTPVKPTSGD